MPDTRELHIEALLRRWQEYQLRGETLSAEDLCCDCPELADELRHRLHELQDRVVSASASTIRASGPRRYLLHPDDWPNLDGYVIEDVLGKGGMGVVFRARQRIAERT